MPSDPFDGDGARPDGESSPSLGYLLFDSLVHHLIEKGLLTKNDALSVVQTAAEVVRGRIHEGGSDGASSGVMLATLARTYASFEALTAQYDRALDGHNVHPLRAPLHGDNPRFPLDD